ncbi:hypothetical protein ES703_29371 [subsurface metagenome]
MQGKQGRYLFAGILGVQPDAPDYEIEQKHRQSAPKSAVVDYYQSKYKSTNQIRPMGVRQIFGAMDPFFNLRPNRLAENLRGKSVA